MPHTWGIKTPVFIRSQCLWAGSLGMTFLCALLSVPKAAVMSARVSTPSSSMLQRCWWNLVIGSCRPTPSAPKGHSHFPATWPCPHTAPLQSPQSYITARSWRVPTTSALFYWLDTSQKLCSRRGDSIEVRGTTCHLEGVAEKVHLLGLHSPCL